MFSISLAENGAIFNTLQAVGAGGSVKASHETQDGKENVKSNLNQRETMSFEATGGNTLLASKSVFPFPCYIVTDLSVLIQISSSPSEWCASVGDFNNWRVIDVWDLFRYLAKFRSNCATAIGARIYGRCYRPASELYTSETVVHAGCPKIV